MKSKDKVIAIYVRVSTGYQVDKDSLPFQKKELTAYCKHILHNENYEIFEDAGKSGKNTNRPGFERMMKKVRAGLISHVIVYKIDRISRNLVDFSLMYDDFKYNRVTFISLNEQFDTSSAIGEAVLKIILVFAELERKLTSERVTDIMIGRAADGLWNGARVPFGWDWDREAKAPIHSETEAVFARLMYDMYEETRSTGKVRDYFNHHDIPTKRGGEWTSKTVADFIRNPMNKGDYRYNYRESARGRKKPEDEVIYVKGAFTPLIDPDQWERCNAIMDHNAEARHKKGFEPKKIYDHVFGGCLVCAECGSYFHSNKDRVRSNGFFPSIYRCGSRLRKLACPAPPVSEVKLGPFVFNYIANMVYAGKHVRKIKTTEELEKILLKGSEFENVAGIDNASLEDTLNALYGRPVNAYVPIPLATKSSAENELELSRLRSEADKLSRAADRLKKAYLFDDEAMSEKEYLETKRDLEEQLVHLNNRIADIENDTFISKTEELSFLKSASAFLVSYEIQAGENIVYSEFAAHVEDKALKNFLALIIEQIIIKDGRVDTIKFKNGLENRFLYH